MRQGSLVDEELEVTDLRFRKHVRLGEMEPHHAETLALGLHGEAQRRLDVAAQHVAVDRTLLALDVRVLDLLEMAVA